MSTSRNTQKFKKKASKSSGPVAAVGNRNLSKFNLGSVVFGCKNNTINECLSKQLFGLPAQHFSYVMNISPGLPLFLFNYSDRKLHGIFEAASCGKMNINPYGWTIDGADRTLYPAQVQICIRKGCQPLCESQFKPVIADNYYTHNHFWFELDHSQTSLLLSLFASQEVVPSIPQFTTKLRTDCTDLSLGGSKVESEKTNLQNLEAGPSEISNWISECANGTLSLYAKGEGFENYFDLNATREEVKTQILHKLQQLDTESSSLQKKNIESSDLPLANDPYDINLNKDTNLEKDGHSDEPIESRESRGENLGSLTKCQSLIAKLVQEVQELEGCKAEQAQKIFCLERRLMEAEIEIQALKNFMKLGSLSISSAIEPYRTIVEGFEDLHLDPSGSIFIIGGYDGESWLSTLDLYDPSRDVMKSLRSMSSARSYASVARLNSQLYVLGGGNGIDWYNTVESYNPENDQWTTCPSLNEKKGSLAGVSIGDKLFAVGGATKTTCLSDVEMLDLDIGRWIPTRSMLQKRFSVAAVELNGVLYATGGFDYDNYLSSAERFDIREHSWTQIPAMNSKRGCHSLVVLNEKIYAVGGFDGNSMVSSIEIYDPRMESWVIGEAMTTSRGYAAAGVVNESICIIGGVKYENVLTDTVEIYKEGHGWQEKTSRVLKQRGFHSAIA